MTSVGPQIIQPMGGVMGGMMGGVPGSTMPGAMNGVIGGGMMGGAMGGAPANQLALYQPPSSQFGYNPVRIKK